MLNMQFDQRVVIDTGARNWMPSPMPGVWRKPLAREEAERGHATSIVRYDPGSAFSRHEHPLGEEVLVLEGTFSDEHGDFGPGTYFRNPPGSGHAPYSAEGCVLFVKLHQFRPDDDVTVCIDTASVEWVSAPGELRMIPLHGFATERVALVECPAGQCFRIPGSARATSEHDHGLEILVVSGEFRDAFGVYPAGTWLRDPRIGTDCPPANHDSVVWLKTGHLPV